MTLGSLRALTASAIPGKLALANAAATARAHQPKFSGVPLEAVAGIDHSLRARRGPAGDVCGNNADGESTEQHETTETRVTAGPPNRDTCRQLEDAAQLIAPAHILTRPRNPVNSTRTNPIAELPQTSSLHHPPRTRARFRPAALAGVRRRARLLWARGGVASDDRKGDEGVASALTQRTSAAPTNALVAVRCPDDRNARSEAPRVAGCDRGCIKGATALPWPLQA